MINVEIETIKRVVIIIDDKVARELVKVLALLTDSEDNNELRALRRLIIDELKD